MQRYGGTPRTRNVIDRAASDLEAGREDDECRGEKPMSGACPAPGVAPQRQPGQPGRRNPNGNR
jgi:hypothetical protein